MPTYRHPRAPQDVDGYPPHHVHVSRGDTREVAADGTFDAPEPVAQAIADHEGVSVESMRVEAPESAAEPSVSDAGETSDGDDGDDTATDAEDSDLVAAGICPWCDEYEGDHVGQHASSAHPDQWAAHKEGAGD